MLCASAPATKSRLFLNRLTQLFVFNVYDIDAERYLNLLEKKSFCKELGLEEVPLLGTQVQNPGTDYLLMAEGDSVLKDDVEREGLVFRDVLDDSVSFKVISNQFLLEGGRD